MHSPRKRYVNTPQGLLHIEESGVGLTPILFLTITSFGAPLLSPALPLLAERGWHAIAMDIMGYGRSDKRLGHWSVEEFANNVVDGILALGIRPRALICGHFSCWTGIELAARNDRLFDALVLDGTPIVSDDWKAEIKVSGGPEPTFWDEDGGHALAYWKRVYGYMKGLNPNLKIDGQPPKRLREAYIAGLEAVCFEPGTQLGAAYFDTIQRLSESRLPTLLMAAESDWNYRHHLKLGQIRPDARSLVWRGIHPLHEFTRPERAVEYVNVVDTFLNEALEVLAR